jgi:threonine/homoserine/homoserine lactone efflux protein
MLALFLLVAVISFLGSLHPGAVNLAVVQTTLDRGRRAGAWLALGGSLPEIGYSFGSAYGLSRLGAAAGWISALQLASIPVLLGAGLLAFRPPARGPVPVSGRFSRASSPFWRGLVLAGTNPQLLPFWSAVWLALSSAMLVPMAARSGPWAFALGTAAGAFALLIGLVWLADRYRSRLFRSLNGTHLRRLTGLTFVGLALWQAFQLWA